MPSQIRSGTCPVCNKDVKELRLHIINLHHDHPMSVAHQNKPKTTCNVCKKDCISLKLHLKKSVKCRQAVPDVEPDATPAVAPAVVPINWKRIIVEEIARVAINATISVAIMYAMR